MVWVIALVVATGLFAAPAQAAGPKFSLLVSHVPDQMQGNAPSVVGGEPATFRLTVTNIGDAPTSAPIVLTDTLGAGLTFSAVDPGPSFACSGDASLPTPLICTRATPLAAGQSDSIQLGVSVVEVATEEAATVTNTATVSGGGVPLAVSRSETARVFPPFAIEYFSARTTTDGSEATEDTAAGGHPLVTADAFQFTHWGNKSSLNLFPGEDVKDAYVTLPPGFFGNPAVATRCPVPNISGIGEGSEDSCPPGSQVGEIYPGLMKRLCLTCGTGLPLYNIVPDYGFPAQFFARSTTAPVVLSAILHPRTDDYAISFGSLASSRASVVGFGARLFGFPDYDGSVGPEAPFLSNSVNCSNAHPTRRLALSSWQNPGAFRRGGLPDLSDTSWLTAAAPAPPVTGCDDPSLAAQFDLVALAARPLEGAGPLQADRPSGLALDFDFPQSNDPTDFETTFDPSVPQAPEPRDITVRLPPGLSISPSSADGLGACSDLASNAAGDQVHYDTTQPTTCPDSSKIGSAAATSPLLAAHDPVDDQIVGAETIPGDVYMLAPHPGDLSQGRDGKFRLLVELENPRYGVNIKLPGVAVADEQTGQLTATFTDNPQLPARHLTINLRSGPRAPLMTPVSCGRFEISTDFLPWGAPQVPTSHRTAGFDLASGPGGSGCPSSPDARQFSPTLNAGPESNVAGRPSPFSFKLTRRDGERELSSLEANAPPGLVASLKGVARCPDGQIAAAGHRSAAIERADPTCPDSSRIGTITTAAGPGPNPFYVQGTAYLAGPYKGAPLSVAFVTPVLSGAFDLGSLVFRAGAYVDPATAQVTVKTDSLPQILDGIPLRLRSIALTLDRPGFTRNPTSCEPMALTASATAESGPSVALSQYLQVGGCADLPFRPRLSVRLSGALARNGRPALRAAITAKPGEANIARAALTLPVTELLDYEHIRAVCTESRYAAGAGGGVGCAPASRYGRVRLFTPLLDKPLEGPLYLRTSGNPGELPDMVASLGGDIHLDLAAHVSSAQGLLRVVFDEVPDVPVEKVVVQLHGGRRGLLVNTTDLCRAGARGSVSFLAHNGKSYGSRPAVNLSCGARHPAEATSPRSSIRRWGEPLKNLLW